MKLHNQIVELLTSLPNIHDKAERRALIYSATLDKELEDQIEFEGTTTQFCHGLVNTLGRYGLLKDVRSPLEAVLDAAKQRVGPDKRSEYERLIAMLRNLPDDEQQQFQRSLKSPRNIPLLLQYALISLIAVVIGAGGLRFYLSTTRPFAFTIYVRDSQGDIVLQNAGSVILEFGSLPQERGIGEYGEAYFEQIYPKFRSQPITLKLKAEGFELVSPEPKYVLKGDSLTVEVQRDNSLATISGTVRDAEERPLNDVHIRIGDLTTITQTDGRFTLTIPPDKQQKQQTLTASKDGYELWESFVYPATRQEVKIVLEEKAE